MLVQAIGQSWLNLDTERLALGLFEGAVEAPESCRKTAFGALLKSLIEQKEAPTEVGATLSLYGVGGIKAKSVILFGLGKRDEFDAGVAFEAGVAVARKVAGKEPKPLAVVMPDTFPTSHDPTPLVEALVAGLVVGTRGCDLRKKTPARVPFSELTLVTEPGVWGAEATVRNGVVIGEAVNLARDLVNTPPAEKTPTVLAHRARAEAEAVGVGVEVWDEARIRAERFGGLIGVASGSDEPPAFVVLDYPGGGGDASTFAVVGKGVTFDSGGLSIKTSSSMEDMKSDMTGAAVVLAAIIAAARLKLPVNLRGYLAFTENMTGGSALRLGDVLTIRDGTTVEVLNSDAEGRLILADALSYAAEAKPARMLDLATLTGACMVALGMDIAGLFSNDDDFAVEVHEACGRSGERTWRLPLDEDFKDLLKSQVADLKNVGGRWGGACSAAKFLEHFVADIPWVHLDIAGPSWHDSDSACHDAGGTGCFVRTLIALFQSQGLGKVKREG